MQLSVLEVLRQSSPDKKIYVLFTTSMLATGNWMEGRSRELEQQRKCRVSEKEDEQ
jgi:hypothetical protein